VPPRRFRAERWGDVMSQIATIFKLDTSKVNWPRGVTIAGVMVLPLVVLSAIHQETYWLSLSYGALYVGLNDPGGEYGDRCRTWPGSP
jgi:hypothetical protein